MLMTTVTEGEGDDKKEEKLHRLIWGLWTAGWLTNDGREWPKGVPVSLFLNLVFPVVTPLANMLLPWLWTEEWC